MAEKDPGMDLKKIRKSVLNNLVSRHSDKESDSDYWSMQLLIKLGLIPDPEATEVPKEGAHKMSVEEREEKLKEVGLFLPKKNLEELNRELERVALENYNKMVEEKIQSLSATELNALRKMGLSNDDIAKLEPGDNPFKDYGYGQREDIEDLLNMQKQMYRELIQAYMIA